ncbi:hypothetical protein ABAC460_16325 [Asticcacaulis sp. AC460]|uniref:transglycosylase SLT domain-containing protein n=1 Tax=Asticcacaulis sp. AC460 TaxID=1282360 RepID=UPI0003C3D044|nr:transglycosylase SLT domain-containing protein [Asticcacaulis sp. AC460]ESQ88227.1 hypothetical protein ABAC460_16325 [Asticcacaulis sp. AC460]
MRLHHLAGVIAGVALLTLAGCATVPSDDGGNSGLPEQPIDAPPPPPPSDTNTTEEPAPPPPPPPPPPELLVSGLPWEINHAERGAWSVELRKQVRANLASFDKATDWADFCPAWSGLNEDNKVEVVSTLAVAIAKYESNYNPHTIYHEPAPLNVDSVGLYQLSYEDGFTWCTLDRANKSLEDPVNNIRCAVPKMAKLIAKDKVVTAGSTGANAMGLARYWSVVRLGSTHKLTEIRAATRAVGACRV